MAFFKCLYQVRTIVVVPTFCSLPWYCLLLYDVHELSFFWLFLWLFLQVLSISSLLLSFCLQSNLRITTLPWQNPQYRAQWWRAQCLLVKHTDRPYITQCSWFVHGRSVKKANMFIYISNVWKKIICSL